jgi:transcriptional regulator with XRE-family HTH domain
MNMPITKQELGNRLRQLRERRGCTQEDVATVPGISRSAAVQLEAGDRNLNSVELMQAAVKVPASPWQKSAAGFLAPMTPRARSGKE